MIHFVKKLFTDYLTNSKDETLFNKAAYDVLQYHRLDMVLSDNINLAFCDDEYSNEIKAKRKMYSEKEDYSQFADDLIKNGGKTSLSLRLILAQKSNKAILSYLDSVGKLFDSFTMESLLKSYDIDSTV